MSNVSSDYKDQKQSFPARGPQVPWGPAAAVVFSILVFFGAQILATIVIISILVALGVVGAQGEAWFMTAAGQFYFVLITDAIIVPAVWLMLRSRRASFRQLGFGRRPIWRDLVMALSLYAIYFVFLIVVSSAADLFTPIDVQQRQEHGFDDLASTNVRLMAFVALVLLPPIVEEIVFRGFVFTGLRTRLTFVWATIITSLLFAAPHLLASAEGEGLLWIAGIDTLMLSFILCYLREKTGALWAPIAVHAIKNCVAYLILISTVTS
jgi:membrane protease YdiL (CAAX protease family)